jgi:hypothetical protein
MHIHNRIAYGFAVTGSEAKFPAEANLAFHAIMISVCDVTNANQKRVTSKYSLTRQQCRDRAVSLNRRRNTLHAIPPYGLLQGPFAKVSLRVKGDAPLRRVSNGSTGPRFRPA